MTLNTKTPNNTRLSQGIFILSAISAPAAPKFFQVTATPRARRSGHRNGLGDPCQHFGRPVYRDLAGDAMPAALPVAECFSEDSLRETKKRENRSNGSASRNFDMKSIYAPDYVRDAMGARHWQ